MKRNKNRILEAKKYRISKYANLWGKRTFIAAADRTRFAAAVRATTEWENVRRWHAAAGAVFGHELGALLMVKRYTVDKRN
jgi:hypothetical protein